MIMCDKKKICKRLFMWPSFNFSPTMRPMDVWVILILEKCLKIIFVTREGDILILKESIKLGWTH